MIILKVHKSAKYVFSLWQCIASVYCLAKLISKYPLTHSSSHKSQYTPNHFSSINDQVRPNKLSQE